MPPKLSSSPPKLTHFLCLPLITPTSKPELQASSKEFKQSTTNKSTPENPDGIPSKAIRPVSTLHLTLGVMSLLTPERIEGAIACLRSLDLKTLLRQSFTSNNSSGTGVVQSGMPKAPIITLRGLNSMHDPASTSILYAPPVDTNGDLQVFCQALRDRFVESGFMVDESRPLVLHATILNTTYVPGVRGKGVRGGHGSKKSRLVIDARVLLEDWADYEWASDLKVEQVAICRMGARKIEGSEDQDEEYVAEHAVPLP